MGVIVLVLTFYFFLDRIGSLHGGRSRLKILFEGFWRTRHILVFVDLHTTAKSVTLSHSNKSTVGSSRLHPTLGVRNSVFAKNYYRKGYGKRSV